MRDGLDHAGIEATLAHIDGAESADAIAKENKAEAYSRAKSEGLNPAAIKLADKWGAMKPAQARDLICDALLIARVRGYEFTNQLDAFLKDGLPEMADGVERRASGTLLHLAHAS